MVICQKERNKFIEAAVAFYRENLRYKQLKMDVDYSFWEMAQWTIICYMGICHCERI